MSIAGQVAQYSLDPDVEEFFTATRCAFGAGNLLDDHLPDDERVRAIVRNVMTVDYAIARGFDAPVYLEYLARFAEETATSCSSVGLPESVRTVYRDHLAQLEATRPETLAGMARDALTDTMETFNLFIPKQCNLSCKGCYAAAIPVSRSPYESDLVESYYAGAISLVGEARAYGARTVYTSGDGEPTIFPRFFDLLEAFSKAGVQWLFFTAGLVFSSEENAELAWRDAQRYLRGSSRDRIAARVTTLRAEGHRKPTARAMLDELAHYRDSVQVYHSIWSARGAVNTAYRRPGIADYDYVTVSSRGRALELPSSLVDMMQHVFTAEHRARLGVEMPVSEVSAEEVPAVAAFVVDNGLRSYFEPTILTGRNRLGDLPPCSPAATKTLAPLLVRKLCGFRNVHQPTVKFHNTRGAFYASPGMGVDLHDLESMGVADPLRVGAGQGRFFAAAHRPLMAFANYVYIQGCKCNDFAAELMRDRDGVARRWRGISAALDIDDLTPEAVIARLNAVQVAS